MSEEKKTNIVDNKLLGYNSIVAIVSDISVLCEIIKSNPAPTVRKDALTHLLQLVEGGMDIDADIIKSLFDAEKDITVATELKRLLNKLKIRQIFSDDPTSKYDRKLSPSEEAKILEEIDQIRKLYDRSIGEQGAFDKKYEVIAEIDKGGMGRICRGIRISDNKPVAIKYLLLKKLAESNNSDRLIARFKREGELLSKKLKHRNIVEAYEYGEADGEYFIVMEYVDGGSLEEMIKVAPLDLQAFKAFGLQLCDAVEYIHKNGVIHRDIKPGNILIDHNSVLLQIKLADFGLAKDKRDKKLSKFSFHAWTDEYSSPQQLQDARNVDERDDIFSMGKSFYHMLTGKTFENGEPYEEITDPNYTVAGGMNIIIKKCIELKPENRFQNVSELRETLNKIL